VSLRRPEKGENIMIDTIATRAVDQNEKVLTDLAKKIWENPETAFNEVK